MTDTPTLAALMPGPAPKRHRRWTLLVTLAAILVIMAAGATYVLWPRDITVTGTLTLLGDDVLGSGPCAGNGGYSDIRQGAQVVVTDAAGQTVGLGQLGQGMPTVGGLLCTFAFTVDVPAGLGFYGVEVSHRGRVQYDEATIQEPLALSLGRPL